MNALFAANIIALLISLFVAGALIGVLFYSPPPVLKAAVAEVTRLGKRLRVLMFGWEFPPFNSGGLGVASLGITRALANENTDVVFVMPKKLPISVPFARFRHADIDEPPIEGHTINSPITPYLSSSQYAVFADGSPVYSADLVGETKRYAQAAAKIAAKEPHDVIYAHDWLAFAAGTAAKRVSGKPFIAHLHATEFDRTGGSLDQRIYDIEREGLHAADRVIAVSHRTKDAAVKHYGVPHEKVHVVWNGIDDATAPVPGDISTSGLRALKNSGHKLVLFMGRITIQKGPDYFIRAAARVAEKDPQALFIVAGSGDMERQMIEQAAALGIADKVLFMGFLRGIEQHEAYELADLFVMPSISEPFGLTVLEALRIGTPVIVSKQSGVAEALPSVLTVDFWDTDKMSEQILSVLSSEKLRAELARKGAAEAATLTWAESGRKIRGVMDEIVPS